MNSSPFKQAVNEAMRMLAADERTVFVGQSVCYDGAAIYDSFDGVPMDRRIEMPVLEDFQLGFCTGLALTGKLPICAYPRFDFMLLCANQLVNHLDKLALFGWKPKVILRTTVGGKSPLDAGPQHTQAHTDAFRLMCKNVAVFEANTAEEVTECYDYAIASDDSVLIVENPCE